MKQRRVLRLKRARGDSPSGPRQYAVLAADFDSEALVKSSVSAAGEVGTWSSRCATVQRSSSICGLTSDSQLIAGYSSWRFSSASGSPSVTLALFSSESSTLSSIN